MVVGTPLFQRMGKGISGHRNEDDVEGRCFVRKHEKRGRKKNEGGATQDTTIPSHKSNAKKASYQENAPTKICPSRGSAGHRKACSVLTKNKFVFAFLHLPCGYIIQSKEKTKVAKVVPPPPKKKQLGKNKTTLKP